jgi:flagellar hook protein FlgE
MGSFSIPLSGLNAAQDQLTSVSNNLANINTDGYKDMNVSFADLFAQTGATSGNGNPLQNGMGVVSSGTNSNFTEGNLNPTGTSSNMALSGNGFFVVQNSSGSSNFTRSGDFTVNNAGYLITPGGQLLLGYPATDGVVNTSAPLQPLQVGTGVTAPAHASTTVQITANLSSTTAVTTPSGALTPTYTTSTAVPPITSASYSFGPTDTVDGSSTLTITSGATKITAPAAYPGESVSDYAAAIQGAVAAAGVSGITVSGVGNQLTISGPSGLTTGGTVQGDVGGQVPTSTVQVFDSLGSPHLLTVDYIKTATNTWSYSVTVPSADVTTGGQGQTLVGSGTLVFNSAGALTSASTVGPINIPSLADGATPPPMAITGLFGPGGSPTITQTASASATSTTVTDGYPSGTLQTYAVQPDGTIAGTFSVGPTRALGQVAVASFANTQGLVNVGGTAYQATVASGTATIGLAGTGGRGTVVGGSVEQSNVDIATEFAKLIVAQQAYSANAKSITTFNQVSQATLAMIQ